jgi:pimeloyl-ACP methyl ester carboxylesterase
MSVRTDDRPAPPSPGGAPDDSLPMHIRHQAFTYLRLRRSSVSSYDGRMPSADPAGSRAQEPATRGMPSIAAPSSITFVVTGDGVSLSVRKSGSATGPVIVFVHGFPDNAHVWSGVTAALAGEARLVTYDVRGAGSSGAPADRQAYGIGRLAADLREIIDAMSPDQRVHLVGHDWGSIQAFHALRTTLSGRVASYTSISGPDLDHIRQWQRRQLRGGPTGWWRLARQSVSSAYIGAFLLPGPVDLAARLGILGRLVTRDPSRLGTRVSRADVRHGLNLYLGQCVRSRADQGAPPARPAGPGHRAGGRPLRQPGSADRTARLGTGSVGGHHGRRALADVEPPDGVGRPDPRLYHRRREALVAADLPHDPAGPSNLPPRPGVT